MERDCHESHLQSRLEQSQELLRRRLRDCQEQRQDPLPESRSRSRHCPDQQRAVHWGGTFDGRSRNGAALW